MMMAVVDHHKTDLLATVALVHDRATNNHNSNRCNNRLNNANDSKSRHGSDHVVISCIRIEEETTMIEKGRIRKENLTMPITDPNQTVATTVAMGTAITNKQTKKTRHAPIK